jgi:hypothetical protein
MPHPGGDSIGSGKRCAARRFGRMAHQRLGPGTEGVGDALDQLAAPFVNPRNDPARGAGLHCSLDNAVEVQPAFLGEGLPDIGKFSRLYLGLALAGALSDGAHALRRTDLKLVGHGENVASAGAPLLDGRPVDPGDLEAAVLAGHDDAVAELLQRGAQFGMIDRADQRVLLVERVVAQRPPLPVGPLGRIGDHRVDVELGIVRAADVVREQRIDEIAGLQRRVSVRPLPGKRKATLGPLHGVANGGDVGGYHALIAAKQADQRH